MIRIQTAATVALAGLLLCALTLSPGTVHAGATPAQKCAIAKNKAAVKRIGAKAKCWQKAIAAGEATADPDCLSAAETKFNSAIEKAELGDGCIVVGDASVIEGAADSCVEDLVALTPAVSTTTTTSTTSTTSTTIPLPVWYQDLDGDSAKNPLVSVSAAERPDGYVPGFLPDDCDDNDPARWPHNPDRCDGIDNDCNAATADCPSGCWTYLHPDSGHRYMFCSSQHTGWEHENLVCEPQGYRRVRIDSEYEDIFVVANALPPGPARPDRVFIGGQEGLTGWRWDDGEQFWPSTGLYTRWASGEPSNAGDCLQIDLGGYWHTASCFSTYAPVVCERY